MNPDNSNDENFNDPDFQSLLVDCLEQLERGEPLDAEQLLADHPEHADGLRTFLSDQALLMQIGGKVRDSNAEPPIPRQHVRRLDDTVDSNPNAGSFVDGDLIRYIGEYEILEEIARGGMGIVFRARQKNLQRVVALKMILAGKLADDVEIERFHREARAAGRLKHPNVVAIHEIGQHEGHHYFTMDYVDGHSLASEIRDTTVPARRAAELVRQVAEAVHFAHEQGTLHRDLKPANILIDHEDQPHVTDFGLAKVVGDEETRAELTASGQILGTPGYMSPEQAVGKQSHIGPGTDIYSLGAVLYACLTGRAPFAADSAVDTLLQVLRNEVASPRTLNPGIPRDLETICLKCLEKEHHRRYGTAKLLAEDLQRFLQGRPVQARPIGPLSKSWRWCRRNPVTAALCFTSALFLLTLAIGAPFAAWQQKRIADQTTVFANQQTQIAEQQTEIANQQQQFAQQERGLRLAAENAQDRERQERERVEELLYAAQVRSAQQAWDANDFDEAFSYLDRCQRDLRGWEHNYLYTRFTDQLRIVTGHHGPVTAIAFSPDGRRVVVGGGAPPGHRYRSELKIWNTSTLELELHLKGHKLPVTSVSFSPDGAFVVSGSEDKSIRLWNAASGEQIRQLSGHSSGVTTVAFHPSGDLIASGSRDNSVIIWETATGNQIRALSDHTEPVTDLEFIQEGERLISGAGDPNANTGVGELIAWQTKTGNVLWRAEQLAGPVTCVDLSPSGDRVVCGIGQYGKPPRGEGRFGYLSLHNADSGKEVMRLDGHESAVRGVAYGRDGAQIASVAADRKLVLWDARSGQQIMMLGGQLADDATCVSYSPTGDRLAIGARASLGLSGELRIWQRQPNEDQLIPNRDSEIQGAAMSPDGNRMVVFGGESGDGELVVWDLQTNRAISRLIGHNAPVTCIDFSSDGDRVVGGTLDNQVLVWDTAAGQPILRISGHDSRVSCVCFSADGHRIVSGGGEMGVLGGAAPGQPDHKPGELRVWDAQTGSEIWTLNGHSGPVTSAEFSPDGRWIISGGFGGSFLDQGEVMVWSNDSGNRMLNLKGPPMAVLSVAASPDSRRFAMAGGLGPGPHKIEVRDIESGDRVLEISGHRGTVGNVAFSPSGNRLVSVGAEADPPDSRSSVRVWSAETGVEMIRWSPADGNVQLAEFTSDNSGLLVHGLNADGRYLSLLRADRRQAASLTIRQGVATTAQCIAFSPDGSRIAAATNDKAVRLWDTTTGKEVVTLAPHAGQVLSVDCSPLGTHVVSSSGNDIYLWDINEPSEAHVLRGHSRMVYNVAFSRDGQRIVSGSSDGTVRIWDVRSGDEVNKIASARAAIRDVAFSADGKRVYGACADKAVRAWDAETGAEIFSVDHHTELVSCLAVSPDGDRIVSGSFDDSLILWDAQSGAMLRTLTGHASSVLSIDFTADGKRIVSGSADRTVGVWDAQSGKRLETLSGHQFFVRSVAASPDGRFFASSCPEDMTIRIWSDTHE